VPVFLIRRNRPYICICKYICMFIDEDDDNVYIYILLIIGKVYVNFVIHKQWLKGANKQTNRQQEGHAILL
jgi:hypothetical protein